MGEYGGESNIKRLARFNMIASIVGEGGVVSGVKDARVLVLAGPDGADVRLLRALGVRPHNIVAVDLNPAYIERSRQICPEATYICNDVERVVEQKKYRRSFSLIHLDYCCPLSSQAATRTIRVGNKGLRSSGFLSFGFMYGREGPRARQELERIRARYLDVITAEIEERLDPNALRAGYEAESDIYRDYEEYVEDQIHLLAHGVRPDVVAKRTRETLVTALMLEACRALHTIYVPDHMYFYRSGRRINGKNRGTPMLFGFGRFERPLRLVGGSNSFNKRLTKELLRAARECKTYDLGDDPDGHVLRSTAITMCERGFSNKIVAEVLDLNPNVLAGWRAWFTRKRERWIDEYGDPLEDNHDDTVCRGLRCPKCRNESKFQVYGTVHEEELDRYGEAEGLSWSTDPDPPTRCIPCGYEGKGSEFWFYLPTDQYDRWRRGEPHIEISAEEAAARRAQCGS